MRGSTARLARAAPTLLRIAVAEAVAYRAEIFVWFLAYTMPFIMMALWTAVARDGPVGRFGEREFQAYFMAALIVRLLTSAWVVWQMNFEVRTGVLAQRLLRPLPVVVAYACETVGALSVRLVLVAPIVLATVIWLGPGILTDDAAQLALVPLTLLGAMAITFLVMMAIGTLALFWESSISLYDAWICLYMVLSGYVVPLELLPPAVAAVVSWLPFRFMLSFPVESALGLCDVHETITGLGVQWAWVAVLAVIAALTWRAGLRRFAAYGG